MRILQIGSDRSKRGILYPHSPAAHRQKKYAEEFGALDIIGFSLKTDEAQSFEDGTLHVYPTNSSWKLFYPFNAVSIAKKLPKPDVISVQDPFEAGLIGWFIAKRLGAPLHAQVHTDFLSDGYKKLSPLNRLRTILAGFVLCRASGVRVVSQKIKEGIQKRYNLHVPITVLPVFADVEKIRQSEADMTLRERFARFTTKALVVSRLEPEKNVTLAIEAFAQSAPNDACLIIIGDGSEEKALEMFAKRSGLADRVFFEGTRDATNIYLLVDIVLVTSKYEGYGLVIIEALAAGKPVLSTDVGIAREAGAIVSNEKDFAADLKKWFENGPREMHLKNYPYRNESDYIQKYCADLIACDKHKH